MFVTVTVEGCTRVYVAISCRLELLDQASRRGTRLVTRLNPQEHEAERGMCCPTAVGAARMWRATNASPVSGLKIGLMCRKGKNKANYRFVSFRLLRDVECSCMGASGHHFGKDALLD
jgi:hypothetical protein